MAKIFMPTQVFETGATLITRLYLTIGCDIELETIRLWQSYEKKILDDGVESDWARAVREGILILPEKNPTIAAGFFHHFQWYCTCFDDNGSYVRKPFFDGLRFQKSKRDPMRVAHYLEKLTRYYKGLTAGSNEFPPAPENWSLAKRGLWNDEVKKLTSFRKESAMTEMTLRRLLLRDFDEDFLISGEWGSSIEDPIVFLPEARAYAKNEYDIIRAICIGRKVSFKLLRQTLMYRDDRAIDQVKIETEETTEDEIITTVTNYYFDVTDCRG